MGHCGGEIKCWHSSKHPTVGAGSDYARCRAAADAERGARRGARLFAEPRRIAADPGPSRGLAARSGHRGVVAAAAANGSGPSVGTRVVALTDNAGWAQRVAVPAHRMAALPDNVRFADAASLPVAGLTALRSLRHGAPLLGKRVLITGAAGGVGQSRHPDRGAIGGACHCRGRQLRPRPSLAGRRRRDHQDIEKAQGLFALILESVGGAIACRRDRACRAEGNRCRLRKFLGSSRLLSISATSRSTERAHTELFLFHVGGGGALCTGSGAACLARRATAR